MSDFIDYYNRLGVKRGATVEEITHAYREMAAKFHPDTVTENKEKATIRFQQINEAQAVLRDESKRREYNQIYDAEMRRREVEALREKRRNEGGPTSGIPGMDDFLRSAAVNIATGGFGFSAGFGNVPRKVMPDGCISLPENDLGLLAALRLAYQAKEDVTFRVKKSESDKRPYVPDIIYEVKKEKGKVLFSRTAADWARMFDKGKDFSIGTPRDRFYGKQKKFKSDSLIPEEIINELSHGRSSSYELNDVSGISEYFGVLKSLGEQMARGYGWRLSGSEMGSIAKIVENGYKFNWERNTRDPDKGNIIDIKFDELLGKMIDAEKRVIKVEGGIKPEGQKGTPAGMDYMKNV